MENTKWVNWKFCEKYNWKVQSYITDNGKWYIGPGGPICYETGIMESVLLRESLKTNQRKVKQMLCTGT